MSVPDSIQDPKDPHSTIDSVVEDYQSSGIPDKKSARLFSYLGATYLLLLSFPLVCFPRFLVVLVGPELVNGKDSFIGNDPKQSYRDLNELEVYLSRLAGLSFMTLAALLVLQTGAIPLTSSISHADENSTSAPYRQPTIFFFTLFFSLLGFGTWNVGMKTIGTLGLGFGATGLWIQLFAGDPQAHGKKSNAIFGGSKSA